MIDITKIFSAVPVGHGLLAQPRYWSPAGALVRALIPEVRVRLSSVCHEAGDTLHMDVGTSA